MKRGWLLSTAIILSAINFVSAYYYSYGNFSLGYFFDVFGAENLFLIGILIGSFALLNWALSRTINNKATSAVVAFIIALFITAGVYFSNFNFESLFYNLGISSDMLPAFLFLFIAGLFIYLGFKFGFGSVVLFAGASLIAISFTNLVEEKGIIFVLGLILGCTGLWLFSKQIKKNKIKKQLRKKIARAADDYFD
jgi:hypothetical protein